MDDIHSTFDELQKTLNVRKSVLLMELEVNYGLKHKVSLCSSVVLQASHKRCGTGSLCTPSTCLLHSNTAAGTYTAYFLYFLGTNTGLFFTISKKIPPFFFFQQNWDSVTSFCSNLEFSVRRGCI